MSHSYAAVYVFKKALFLINAISLRFANDITSGVPTCATAHLPVFSDNVIPSILVHLGVLDMSHAKTTGLRKAFRADMTASLLQSAPYAEQKENRVKEVDDGPHLSLEEAYILRAAAVDACEAVVRRARQLGGEDRLSNGIRAMTLPELDAWLWAGAKDRSDYRLLPRFVERGTIFY